MIWQDALLSAAQVGFIFALLPTVFGPNKPAKSTSFFTSFLVFCCAGALWGLGVYISALLNGICGVLWLTLFIQAYKREPR